MIQTRVINELNQTYFEIVESDLLVSEDYRVRMLEENETQFFIRKLKKYIDDEEKEFYDVSDKEILINIFGNKSVGRNDIIKLFKCISSASSEAEKLLIEEGNIILRPECIFLDSKTMNYQFVCIPVSNPETEYRENILYLLQFFLTKLDNNDIELLKVYYSLFDKIQKVNISSKGILEMLLEGLERDLLTDESCEKSEPLPEEKIETGTNKKERRIYYPSFKEVLAIAFAGVGIYMIGYHTYNILLLTL